MMDYAQLGKRIRSERLMLRWTLENLAERTDKSINFIEQVERGDGKPSLKTMVDIANALGTTADALLRDSPDASQQDPLMQEIAALLSFLDGTGRQFLLEVVRRYRQYHQLPEKDP